MPGYMYTIATLASHNARAVQMAEVTLLCGMCGDAGRSDECPIRLERQPAGIPEEFMHIVAHSDSIAPRDHHLSAMALHVGIFETLIRTGDQRVSLGESVYFTVSTVLVDGGREGV